MDSTSSIRKQLFRNSKAISSPIISAVYVICYDVLCSSFDGYYRHYEFKCFSFKVKEVFLPFSRTKDEHILYK